MKIEKTEVFGFKAAMRGMRNPMNSWSISDSYENNRKLYPEFVIGNNDLELALNLIKAGPEHSKFLRFITVYVDIEMPLYFWKEWETYKIGTSSNSCSTMHKILSRPMTAEDFQCEEWSTYRENSLLHLNELIKEKQFRELIQDLPSNYIQKRTVALNYQVLRNMYSSRKNHKLIEWHKVCEWIETLVYSEFITK